MNKRREQEIWRFRRIALRRFDDAQVLFAADRFTAATYFAGYSVECMLKALVISVTPDGQVEELVRSFTGNKAHNYEWLKNKYSEMTKGKRTRKGQMPFPMAIKSRVSFSLIAAWTTELRYDPGEMREEEARSFLNAVREVVAELQGRL